MPVSSGFRPGSEATTQKRSRLSLELRLSTRQRTRTARVPILNPIGVARVTRSARSSYTRIRAALRPLSSKTSKRRVARLPSRGRRRMGRHKWCPGCQRRRERVPPRESGSAAVALRARSSGLLAETVSDCSTILGCGRATTVVDAEACRHDNEEWTDVTEPELDSEKVRVLGCGTRTGRGIAPRSFMVVDESDLDATTVAIDVVRSVLESAVLAARDGDW